MKTQTIKPAALAKLAEACGNFSVSVHMRNDGWTVYVHNEVSDYLLLTSEREAVALFDSLGAVEKQLRQFGICQFDVNDRLDSESKDPDYDAWLSAQVQQALDDPSPLVPHEEAVRQIKAAITIDF